MFKVCITDGMHPAGLEKLSHISGFQISQKPFNNDGEQAAEIMDADLLVIRSATKVMKDKIEKLPNLKGVIRAGVGIDNVDLAASNAAGVWVWNAPRGNFQSTAELALAMIFSLARKIPQATASMRSGLFPKKELSRQGRQISGSTLGVFGAGNIGFKLARMGRALGMKVLICDPIFKSGSGFEKVEFNELLARSDFISIHSPILPETKHAFNRGAFEKMKNDAFLINCARGGIVEDSALVWALENNEIAGAGLDVFEIEPPSIVEAVYAKLLTDPRVVLSPHIGASTIEAQYEVAMETVEKLEGILRSSTEKNYRCPKPLNEPANARLTLNFA